MPFYCWFIPCACVSTWKNVILGVCALIDREKNAHIVCILLQ